MTVNEILLVIFSYFLIWTLPLTGGYQSIGQFSKQIRKTISQLKKSTDTFLDIDNLNIK